MSESAASILLVEDDERLATLTQRYLQQNNFTVYVEHSGDKALDAFHQYSPELVILDIMLPGTDGLTICTELRKFFSGPILMLTARNTDLDEVIGLETGADDYLTKPAEPMVLLARIRSLLRRSAATLPSDNSRITLLGRLKINHSSRQVWLEGEAVQFSTQEFDLLVYMVSHAESVLSRDDLMKHIRGIEYNGLDRTVDVYVSRLRKLLKDDPDEPFRIKTIWGKGYLFVKDAW